MGESGNHSGQEQPVAAGGSLSPEANAALLRRLRKGDESAYHELVDRFSGPLFRIAYSMVGNSADAEDVVQETFAAAFSGIERFRGESSLKTWLTQILVRQSARLHRSRGRRWTLPIDETQHASGDEAAAADSRMDVIQMLQTLSPEHREVIVLRELQSMSYEEMSEALKIPRGTVESRLHRARTELREKFGDRT